MEISRAVPGRVDRHPIPLDLGGWGRWEVKVCGVVALLVLGGALIAPVDAQVDFFPPSRPALTKPKPSGYVGREVRKAKVIFFISPKCRSCPGEATKLEGELKRLGMDYEIEGVFLGDPSQVGKYLSELRSYPFNFALGVDMDGSITKGYGVKAFPAAVVEVGARRIVIGRAEELEEKLR